MSLYTRFPRRRVQTINDEPSLTQQSFRETCDINHILSRLVKTGQQLPTVQITDEILDLSGIPTYQESLNLVIAAESKFMQLDPKIRLRFNNDPAKFLSFASNPANQDEMYALGMAIKPVPPAPSSDKDPEAKA